jgi:uncharacterized membrane protein
MLSAIVWEWVDLAVRWLHVIAGIAWIGSSFYFVHLDASLKRRDGLPDGAGGEAWQVHAGGFYHMVKYMVAPTRMPDELTWFKWEAYTTWLSGFALLVLVYYFGAELYLIDPAVLDLPPWGGVLISLAGLALGWLVYDRLCKSALGDDDNRLAAVGFVFLVALAWLFTLLLSGRGAYVQMGALVGTMMVANVFFIIIPNQRKVVTSLLAGETPDPGLGRRAKQRSMHNNYLTLPVVFLMISNHYPLAFASDWNWVIFALVLVVGAMIRHFYNVRHTGRPSPWWTWGVASAGMLLIVWLSTLQPTIEAEAGEAAVDVDPVEVENVVLGYCSMCHARQPLWEGVVVPPKGVLLETPEQIRLHARQIYLQAVLTDAMPPPVVAELDPDSRRLLAAWYEAGAPMPAR